MGESRAVLPQAACATADVILLLFATDRDDALARVGSHWLPELRRIGAKAPVILVGTKSDLKSADHNLQQASESHLSFLHVQQEKSCTNTSQPACTAYGGMAWVVGKAPGSYVVTALTCQSPRS